MRRAQTTRRSIIAVTGVAAAAAALLGAAPASTALAGSGKVGISWAPGGGAIVMASSADAAAAAVRATGGTVTRDLPLVDGVAARLTPAQARSLTTRPGVRGVVPDERVTVRATTTAPAPTPNAKSVFNREIGADWMHAGGYDGTGVRIALVDTGVANVPDLAGKVVPISDPGGSGLTVDCMDLSGEGNCNDSYGHGTFLAGLMVGSGASSGGLYKGVAPGAQVISIKLAGRDGSSDVSKVLAAIQWVVSFKDTYNIRVLNLSLGTDSKADYRVDPLNYAVEKAWKAGIVVNVAAGNLGPAAGTISKPADDPLVLTVGTVDDHETPARSDDLLPRFTGRGPTAAGLAKPDIVAPGARVVSLRAPSSTVETDHPGGGVNAIYRRASGTSMSTAVVSGATALLLQARPTWTPDRVKFAFMSTAQNVTASAPLAVGRGLIFVPAAAFAQDGLANQAVVTLSDATGTLDGSRGSVFVTGRPCAPGETVVDPDCAKVHGQKTAQGLAYMSDQYRNTDWTGSSWYTSQWQGNALGSSWYAASLGSSWYGSSWYGSSWYGSSWYGSSWYGDDDGSGSGGSGSNTLYGLPSKGAAWLGAWL